MSAGGAPTPQPAVAARVGRPRLSVSIITRDSASRLALIVSWARAYADEVVIGVDEASTDATLQVACDLADTVYRFRHQGQLAAVHLLPFEHCTGDWILRLDDDECMEEGFGEILPGLLEDAFCTYYHFQRKWLISEHPSLYIHQPPWFPDYQARLIRNDRRLVWKPPRYHSGYLVSGQPGIENRVSILHFEPIWCSEGKRKAKPWRPAGDLSALMALPSDQREAVLRPCDIPKPPALPERSAARPPDPSTLPVHQPAVRALPPWGCHFDRVEHIGRAKTSQTVLVRIVVTNTGELRWSPQRALWPQLHVVGDINRESGHDGVTFHAPWIAVPALVHPGQSIEMHGTFLAPDQPGRFELTWDMDSSGDCRFAQCGSSPYKTMLEVSAW